jgi:hypothetical protein
MSHYKGERKMVHFRLPAELAETLDDAAYWTRQTVTDIVVAGVRAELARLQKQYGEPFPLCQRCAECGRKFPWQGPELDLCDGCLEEVLEEEFGE